MSDGNLKELYAATEGTFDIPFGPIPGISVETVLREAYEAAIEIGSLLYVYKKDGMYRLTPQFPDDWKTNGVARVYPGGRIERRKNEPNK